MKITEIHGAVYVAIGAVVACGSAYLNYISKDAKMSIMLFAGLGLVIFGSAKLLTGSKPAPRVQQGPIHHQMQQHYAQAQHPGQHPVQQQAHRQYASHPQYQNYNQQYQRPRNPV